MTYHRYSIRKDGFVSASASTAGGSFTTRPIQFTGARLVLNYATSAIGGIRVEIQGEDGKPLPGCSLEECVEMFGDSSKRPVTWTSGASLGTFAEKPIRLRFVLKDADLFSLRFGPR